MATKTATVTGAVKLLGLDAARLASRVDVVYHLAQAREFPGFPEKVFSTIAVKPALDS